MKRFFCLALALALALCLTCAAAETAVASFYPIWLFTRELTDGIDGVTVVNLAPPDTGCLHDYQLQTGDMKALAAADVFLVNGAGMESYLSLVYGAFPELPVVDASAGVPLLSNAELAPIALGDAETEANAHIWLDPANAGRMTVNLCEGLAQAWPQHREALEANRDAFLARLETLNETLRAGIDALPNRKIITFHEAFPYFARAYGLQVVAVVNKEPGEALSPRALASLIDLVAELGVPPLFVEPQYDDLSARTLAAETGAKVYVLDPIVTGEEGDSGLGVYESRMLENLAVLREALGGEP